MSVDATAERHALSREQAEGLSDLAARLRELAEAVVLSDAPPDEITAIRDEVAALTRRLAATRQATPPVPGFTTGPGPFVQLASPVTGRLNPIAPPVDIEVMDDRSVRSEFVLGPVYEGPPGLVHGGVSALIMDHVLGAAALAGGSPGFTATLEMRYRRPTPNGVPLVATAAMVRVEGRKTFVEGAITGPDGQVTVQVFGTFVMPATGLR
jgi:uncharacterized protein (TIGR00369 family)